MCKQCTTNSDCGNLGTCNSNNTCTCRPQTSGNKIGNAGFNSGGLSPWTGGSGTTLVTGEDADWCPAGKALLIADGANGVSQCFAIGAGVTYYMGLQSKNASNANGGVKCALWYFDTADCSGGGAHQLVGHGQVFARNTGTDWSGASAAMGKFTTSPMTAGARLDCYSNAAEGGGQALIDDVFVNIGGYNY